MASVPPRTGRAFLTLSLRTGMPPGVKDGRGIARFSSGIRRGGMRANTKPADRDCGPAGFIMMFCFLRQTGLDQFALPSLLWSSRIFSR